MGRIADGAPVTWREAPVRSRAFGAELARQNTYSRTVQGYSDGQYWFETEPGQGFHVAAHELEQQNPDAPRL